MPRSDRARLMDFVKLRGVVEGSRRSMMNIVRLSRDALPRILDIETVSFCYGGLNWRKIAKLLIFFNKRLKLETENFCF